MTKTHYQSPDQIIEVITTNEDNRWPRHNALMTMVKMRPKAHTRCRQQDDCITLMITFNELRAIAEAIASCDPNFTFTMSKTAQNKPESRRLWWKKHNEARTLNRRNR